MRSLLTELLVVAIGRRTPWERRILFSPLRTLRSPSALLPVGHAPQAPAGAGRDVPLTVRKEQDPDRQPEVFGERHPPTGTHSDGRQSLQP